MHLRDSNYKAESEEVEEKSKESKKSPTEQEDVRPQTLAQPNRELNNVSIRRPTG